MHAIVFTTDAQGAPLVGLVVGHTGPSSFVLSIPTLVDPTIPGPGPAEGMPDPSAVTTSASATPASSTGGVDPRASTAVSGGNGCKHAGAVQSCMFGGFASGLLHPAPAPAISEAAPIMHATSAMAVVGRTLPMDVLHIR